MTSRYASDPNCADCGRKKGKYQRTRLRCYSCQIKADKASKNAKHGAHIEARYGITREEYRQLWAFQAGKCAICCRATGASKRLAVDHDHNRKDCEHPHQFGCRECVRGLLCSTCNEYLGRIRDDPRVGERMARYLRVPPFRQMIKGKR